jgi:SAM-dependent methyltransferase
MNDKQFGSWEEAVEWLVAQPDQQELVKACYYDRPARSTAERFWSSDEWRAIRNLLPGSPGKVLDVGAGNGIASYALAKDGWDTTALEPDPSNTVGGGAIRALALEAGLNITVVQEFGERLPFPDATFDVIHARQVLHHANNLGKFCGELFRVLKSGGILIATREHVISHPGQLDRFLERHALHKLYGGENAFQLKDYKKALGAAGFSLDQVIGPFDSVINYAPFTRETLKAEFTQRLAHYPFGKVLAAILFQSVNFDATLKLLSLIDRRPGRLFSFVARKPWGIE